jgi:preprotein translocase subunit SecF
VRHLRIVPDDTNFSFIRFRRFSFPVSAILSILSLVAFFTVGLNYGIDFKGGTLMEVRAVSGQADVGSLRSTLEGLGLGEVQLQEIGNKGEVMIRLAQQPGGDREQQVAAQKVRDTLGTSYVYERVEVIGPRVSQELVTLGTVGIFAAILCILVYLWFRFDWQFAVGAMIANIHDIVLTIGFMSVTQIDFDLTSVAALLTILGYSLNDTVVIYDRIRELLRKYKRMSLADLLDNAINATLSRSIITHVTVTLALLALLIFGGRAIHSFTATMLFGVVLVGTYTSIFIASPVLIYLGLRSGGATQEADAPVPAAAAPS